MLIACAKRDPNNQFLQGTNNLSLVGMTSTVVSSWLVHTLWWAGMAWMVWVLVALL